jgi:hypothetical protein
LKKWPRAFSRNGNALKNSDRLFCIFSPVVNQYWSLFCKKSCRKVIRMFCAIFIHSQS